MLGSLGPRVVLAEFLWQKSPTRLLAKNMLSSVYGNDRCSTLSSCSVYVSFSLLASILSTFSNPSSTVVFLPPALLVLAYRASQAEDSLRAREAAVAEAEEVRLSLESRVKETEGRMAEMAANLEKKGTELAVLRQELEEERDERLKLEEDLEVGSLRFCVERCLRVCRGFGEL